MVVKRVVVLAGVFGKVADDVGGRRPQGNGWVGAIREPFKAGLVWGVVCADPFLRPSSKQRIHSNAGFSFVTRFILMKRTS